MITEADPSLIPHTKHHAAYPAMCTPSQARCVRPVQQVTLSRYGYTMPSIIRSVGQCY